MLHNHLNSVFPSPPATRGFFTSTNTYPISSAHICNMTTSFLYIQSSSVQLDLNGTELQLLDGSTLYFDKFDV